MARPEQIRRVLLDASALIGVIKGEPEFDPLRSLLAAVDRGEVRLVESSAIFAEVQPSHEGDSTLHHQVRANVRALLESPATELIDVSTVVGRRPVTSGSSSE